MVEKMMPSDLYRRKQKPITDEQKAKMIVDSMSLEQRELERSGKKIADSEIGISNWQKKINEKNLRDDHEFGEK